MPNDNLHDLTTTEGVSAYLQGTPFSSRETVQITGGSGNFTFRLFLDAPHEGRSTLVLKHAKPYVAQAPSIPFGLERQACPFKLAAVRELTFRKDIRSRVSETSPGTS
jgi:hypothetical protein